jgi:hypothetical protein
MDLLAALVVAQLLATSDGITERRARIPNHIARRIAGEIFPEFCGPRGLGCAIIYDERTGCLNQFMVRFPDQLHAEGDRPPYAYVTVDAKGKVSNLTSKPRPCPKSTI